MGPDDEQLWLWRMERLDERERQEEAEPWEGTPVPSGEAAPGPQEVPPPADNEPPRIEPALRVMQAEQVKRVLRRYAPRGRATRKHDMIVEISATLGSPQRLDAVIQGLSPLERALLEELARRGGIADGWELVTFAVLQGHEPPEKHERDLAYGRAIGRSRAARFLAGPIRDGLLIPSDTAAAWFDFGYGGTWSDRVHADARLLARLAPREVPAPAVLPLDAVADPRLEARHPAAVVLETFDVLQLVADEGGLNVTRRGTIAKPFLRRLEKARPHLWDRLEIQLRTLAALGLVRPPSDDTVQQPWSVDTDAVAHLRRLPLFKLYAVFVDASCEVRDPNVDRTWIHEPGGGHDPRPFWRAMLDALPTLPDAPAAVDAAARGLWAGTLEPVFGRAPFPGQPPSPATSVPGAVREMLLGPLPHLALLAAGEGTDADGEPVEAVAPARGARWYARARTLARKHAARDPAAEPGPESLRPGARPPSEPNLLVQPNFEVLAYLDRLSTDALGALACASVTRIDAHTAQLHIDRTSVGRALALGDDVEILVERLRLHAGTVPDNVATTMRDWAARRDRLRVHVDARVLEYANEAERDDALSRLRGARALAERFVLLDPDAPIPATGHAHHYLDPPHPSLTFGHDSAVRIKGDVDLPGRAALHALTTPHRNGQRRIAPEAVRASTRPGEHMEALVARARNQLPPQLHAMMRAWSGASPRPVVATASLFRHPDASAWAEHPDVGPLLGAQIAPTTFLVRPEQQEALRAQLEALGVTPTTALDREPEAPPSAEDGALQTGLSTRKKRELIEAALEAGHELELRYTEERERYDRYGRVRRSKGKARTEVVTPDAVEYAGSIPYLLASASPRGTERIIRIGYIDAIAMRSEGSPAG